MRFTHQRKRITLRGVKDCTSQCRKLKIKKLKGLLRKGGVAQLVQLTTTSPSTTKGSIDPKIQELIAKNAELFNKPTKLPPHRELITTSLWSLESNLSM